MHFTKMQGLGNDYVYVDCMHNMNMNFPDLARRVSDRHFGIGSDGLICICPSDTADVRMRIFNRDGSEGAMCGNGIRCVGKFVYDKKIVPKTKMTVETDAGVKKLELILRGSEVTGATADMGVPQVGEVLDLAFPTQSVSVIPVNMGNDHIVLFTNNTEELDSLDLAKIGPLFEHHHRFSHGVNTEFCAPLSSK